MTSRFVEFDLAIRGRVAIAASAAEVWHHLERPATWKSSIVSLERIAGASGQVGEVIRVGQRPEIDTVFVLMKTLRLDPPVYRVQSLTTEDRRTTRGYVIYSIDACDSRSRVTCDVVATCAVPATALEGRSRDELCSAINAATQEKLDADHAALKLLIERGAIRDAAR